MNQNHTCLPKIGGSIPLRSTKPLRIVNAGHVTVENVKALNARHDGLYAGFDLNGGFEYGKVRNFRTENCARTGVA